MSKKVRLAPQIKLECKQRVMKVSRGCRTITIYGIRHMYQELRLVPKCKALVSNRRLPACTARFQMLSKQNGVFNSINRYIESFFILWKWYTYGWMPRWLHFSVAEISLKDFHCPLCSSSFNTSYKYKVIKARVEVELPVEVQFLLVESN